MINSLLQIIGFGKLFDLSNNFGVQEGKIRRARNDIINFEQVAFENFNNQRDIFVLECSKQGIDCGSGSPLQQYLKMCQDYLNRRNKNVREQIDIIVASYKELEKFKYQYIKKILEMSLRYLLFAVLVILILHYLYTYNSVIPGNISNLLIKTSSRIIWVLVMVGTVMMVAIDIILAWYYGRKRIEKRMQEKSDSIIKELHESRESNERDRASLEKWVKSRSQEMYNFKNGKL